MKPIPAPTQPHTPPPARMLEQQSRALAGNPMAARVAELEALVVKLEREIDQVSYA